MPDANGAPTLVRLSAAEWRAYADGLRTSCHPVAGRLLPRVAAAAAADGEVALVLRPDERAVLRDIDQRAAEALMGRPCQPRRPLGRNPGRAG